MTGVRLVRDNTEGGGTRPANSAAGKHLALCAHMHDCITRLQTASDQPDLFADMIQAMHEMVRDSKHIRWNDVEVACLTRQLEDGGFTRGLVQYIEDA